MHFDLVDLRLFANVCARGTITHGATDSHMTLASASERLRGMEDAARAALLVRGHAGVTPTAAGRVLLDHARIVLAEFDRLAEAVASQGRRTRGLVRLSCNTSALAAHLPDLLASFLAAHPSASLDVEERTSGATVAALREGRADVGIVSDAVEADGLESARFAADPLVLLVAASHPLGRRRSVSFADAVDERFVGLVETNALQALIVEAAHRLGRRLDYRIRLRSLDAVCRMVAAGVGVAIVPRAMTHAGARRVALTDTWAVRELRVVARRFDTLSPAAQRLVERLVAESAGPSGSSVAKRR